MSKQVQLKFKKLLKKAEFIHADLEYHEELISEAKREFFVAVEEIFKMLPADVRSKLNNYRSAQSAKKRKGMSQGESIEGDPDLERDLIQSSDGTFTDSGQNEGKPGAPGPEISDIKFSETKKLFHKIAAIAHPDKTALGGFHPSEIDRLEELFKKATEAYNNNNWYVLYSVATSLGIDIINPSDEHADWLEEDIKSTFGRISNIASQVAWIWYVGNVTDKQMALNDYFRQVYNHSLQTTDSP